MVNIRKQMLEKIKTSANYSRIATYVFSEACNNSTDGVYTIDIEELEHRENILIDYDMYCRICHEIELLFPCLVLEINEGNNSNAYANGILTIVIGTDALVNRSYEDDIADYGITSSSIVSSYRLDILDLKYVDIEFISYLLDKNENENYSELELINCYSFDDNGMVVVCMNKTGSAEFSSYKTIDDMINELEKFVNE